MSSNIGIFIRFFMNQKLYKTNKNYSTKMIMVVVVVYRSHKLIYDFVHVVLLFLLFDKKNHDDNLQL
jgi:cadmium resistance protein CadD (predicted permease)